MRRRSVPNTFMWDDVVERAWADSGVRWVVTCGRRYEGRAADGRLLPASSRIVNGQPGSGGVGYVVRDVSRNRYAATGPSKSGGR